MMSSPEIYSRLSDVLYTANLVIPAKKISSYHKRIKNKRKMDDFSQKNLKTFVSLEYLKKHDVYAWFTFDTQKQKEMVYVSLVCLDSLLDEITAKYMLDKAERVI